MPQVSQRGETVRGPFRGVKRGKEQMMWKCKQYTRESKGGGGPEIFIRLVGKKEGKGRRRGDPLLDQWEKRGRTDKDLNKNGGERGKSKELGRRLYCNSQGSNSGTKGKKRGRDP